MFREEPMEESETRGRDLSTTGPGCASVESHHLRPSSASSSTSTEDIIHRPRAIDIVFESQLHGTTSATVTETGGGSSTNGSETPIRPRKRTRNPESWKKNVAKAKRAKGEECVSPTTGKTIPARKAGPACKC